MKLMIKQHKFRYYDPYNDCFTYSDTFCEDYLNYYFRNISKFFDQLARCDEGENNPILEYWSTVDDINGKGIYAGDIVKIAFDEIGSPIPMDFTGEVRFMESCFLVMNDSLELDFPVWQEISQWEVIGNIHQIKNKDKCLI